MHVFFVEAPLVCEFLRVPRDPFVSAALAARETDQETEVFPLFVHVIIPTIVAALHAEHTQRWLRRRWAK